jgi:sugar phosphate isomerase/epimerase
LTGQTGRITSLAAGVVPESDPPTTVAAAAAAGFEGSGIWVEVADWSPATTREVRRRLDDTGLVALDAEVVRITADGGVEQGLRLIEIAAAVGARNVLCISLDPDLNRTAAGLARLCEEAQRSGIRCVLEFMRFTTVRSLEDAVRVVRAAGQENGGVLVDALHLARCGHRPADVGALDASLLPYAQICDAPGAGPGEEALRAEALDGRLLPGDGELPLADLLSALPADLPLSVEVRSASLRQDYPDPVQRASAVRQATRRVLAASES